MTEGGGGGGGGGVSISYITSLISGLGAWCGFGECTYDLPYSCCCFFEECIFRELNLKHFFTNSIFKNDLP